jgi:hypothetical protein
MSVEASAMNAEEHLSVNDYFAAQQAKKRLRGKQAAEEDARAQEHQLRLTRQLGRFAD